jgi:DNA-binding LacI/PurR family transcriptional regulator
LPTIKEVAELAGVSVGTVSHVITGSAPVSHELKDKVQAAIQTLDYHPNHVARSLKTSRTRTLGIIVPDMTISFYPQVIHGAETAARERGYSLIAVNSLESAERQKELISLMRSQQVEGILLVIASAPTPMGHMARLIEAGIPVVCLDRVPDDNPVDSVSVDDESAAKMGTDHLRERGYSRIAIVTGPLHLRNEQRRLEGYRQSLRGDGVVWEESRCRERLRDAATRPDALLCTNGPTALSALRAMRDRGLKTPDDIGFVTFDELAVEDLFTPAITTIVQPAYEIGSRAAAILLDRVAESPRAEGIRTVRLPATLRIRESSRSV